jgi:hypothetical protein
LDEVLFSHGADYTPPRLLRTKVGAGSTRPYTTPF